MVRLVGGEFSSSRRILLCSHRNIYEQEVWRAAYREFEAVIQAVDTVDLIAPGRARWFHARRNNALRIGKCSQLVLNPGVHPVSLDRQYDLMFVVCEKPSELLNITAIEGWKDKCKTSICWLTEFYENDIPSYRSALNVLAGFDHIVLSTIGNRKFKAMFPGKVSYLPPAVDAIKFCPYPNPSKRVIDVLSIGRRSGKTHSALLRMATDNGMFYVYDTIKDLGAYDIDEHRFLFASMAKRSRYFIVNPGKIDRPEETGGQSEFGQRYFEGLGAGAILLGERPKYNPEFDALFNWTDAVVDVPFGSEEIAITIQSLDKDPDRQMAICRANVRQALLFHDWSYRWASLLKLAELEPAPMLVERKRRLASMAAMVEGTTGESGVRRN